MKCQILLINPWIHDFSAYNLWYEPLGLLYLASLLRDNGVQVRYIDCLDAAIPALRNLPQIKIPRTKPSGKGGYASERISRPAQLACIPRHYHRYGMPPGLLMETLAAVYRPDIVMVTSMMTYWYPGLFDTISEIRKTFPATPIIVGGNYVTLCPQHARLSGADYCLPGPGESSLPPLLKDLMGINIPHQPDNADLDAYPYPAFDLISSLKHVPILTSRGCPFRCSYCASHLLNPTFRRRDPIRVADEIAFWHARQGVMNFSFYDDALLTDATEMALPLFREIIRRGLQVKFHCPNGLHLREITPELSVLMYKSGFRTIRFGFETSDSVRQRETGGKTSNKELGEAIGYLKRAGYDSRDIGIYILCGLPGQSADEVLESIRLVQSLGGRPIIAEYSPIPGTGLWPDAVATSPYPIATEPLFHNNTLLPCRSASLADPAYQSLKRMTRISA